MTSILKIWGRWDVLSEIYIEMFKKKMDWWVNGGMERYVGIQVQ